MSENKSTKYLYKYLRSQFSNLKEAKVFMNKFANEMNQNIMGINYTCRAMSFHCSQVLEGFKEDQGENDMWCTIYTETKYGSELYFSIVYK